MNLKDLMHGDIVVPFVLVLLFLFLLYTLLPIKGFIITVCVWISIVGLVRIYQE